MNRDWDQHEEFNILPEHTEQSEYSPEYPDVSFFKESAVTAREENIFQGEAPAAETDAFSARREKRRKKSREFWLRNLLGAAVRGGAVLLATGALVSTLVLGQEQEPGSRGEDAAEQLVVLQRKAFKHPVDYGPKDLSALWAGKIEAPHQYDMQTPYVRREPDCEHDGLVEYLCTECGLALQYPIPGGHKAAPVITENIVQSTCTENGHFDSVVYCEVCHKELSRLTKYVIAKGHTPAEAVKENEVAPTCTTPGSYEEVTYCSVCHEELSRNEIAIEATGHTPAEAVAENEIPPTCTETGSQDSVVYCEVCHEELSREHVVTAAKGHSPGETEILQDIPATCTEAGLLETRSTCMVCGAEVDYEVVMTMATGHMPAEAVAENEIPPTCIEEGQEDTVVYCEVCHEELSRKPVILPMVDHTEADPEEENRIEATCTENGSFDSVVYCAVCHEELSRETITLFASGHKEDSAVEENRAEATCTAEGHYDTVVYCSVCHEELSRKQVAIPALGHSYTASVTDPTCTERGYTTHTCSRCQDSYIDTYKNALGHNYRNSVTEPTCTAQGYTTHTCSRCGNSYTDSTVAALGHSYGTWTTTKAATCVAAGSEQRTCSRCGNVETRSIAATGQHTAGQAQIENRKSATCTEDGGYDSVTYCTVCNTKLSTNHITTESAHGHSFPLMSSANSIPVCVCSECGVSGFSFDYLNDGSGNFSYTMTDAFAKALVDAGFTSGDFHVEQYIDEDQMWLGESGYWNGTSNSGTIPYADLTTGTYENCYLVFEYGEDYQYRCRSAYKTITAK